MLYKIEIHPQVYEDIDAAVTYYNSQITDLGFDFYRSFLDSYGRLQTNPKMFQKVYNSNRRVVMKTFPFSIFFQIYEPNRIVIKAVFHHSRNPTGLKTR